MPGRGGRRLFTIILLCLLIVASAGLVVFSPLALELWEGRSVDWTRLSEVGQTYGAASALLAVLALVGIAVSLVLQSREAKGAREQTLRNLHSDLMKMAMEDPLYRACWGEFFSSDDDDAQRAHMYVNQIINNWLTMWELRGISEAHLRAIAAVVLVGPYGRKFWSEVRGLRMKSASSRRERRFNRILDEEYERGLKLAPKNLDRRPSGVKKVESNPPGLEKGMRGVSGGAVAVIAAAITYVVIRHLRAPR